MNRKLLNAITRIRHYGVTLVRAVNTAAAKSAMAGDATIFLAWEARWYGEVIYVLAYSRKSRGEDIEIWLYCSEAYHDGGIGPFMVLPEVGAARMEYRRIYGRSSD